MEGQDQYRVIGVVGAGVMGAGVAQSLAQTGHQVILVDLSTAILDRARQEIRNGVRSQALFLSGKQEGPAPDPKAVLSHVQLTTSLEELRRAEFVVENVTEKWSVKEPVYKQLDALCQPQVVFAANTSAIPITRLASLTGRPAQIIGMHFMNPVPQKPLVEVIRGHHTSDETVEAARRFLSGMKKECIVVKDSPGFVSNRVLMLTVNEAAFLVHEGVSSPAEIDQLFVGCFGHKMGPLATADLIGLDTILLSIEVLYESFSDSKYRPCPLLRKMVDAGLHGRKSGQGFFTY